MKTWIWIVIGLVMFFGLIGFIAETSGPSTPKLNEFGESYKIDEFGACSMSRDFIEIQLRSPSSAKFSKCGNLGDTRVAYQGNQIYLINGYVDSQNGFGALIRSNYYVEVKHNDALDRWTYIDSEIY